MANEDLLESYGRFCLADKIASLKALVWSDVLDRTPSMQLQLYLGAVRTNDNDNIAAA